MQQDDVTFTADSAPSVELGQNSVHVGVLNSSSLHLCRVEDRKVTAMPKMKRYVEAFSKEEGKEEPKTSRTTKE